MPLYYTVGIGANLLTTSGTTNTEVTDLFIKAGVNTCNLQAIYVHGKGSGLTTLNAVSFRLKNWTTASVVGTGTAVTPRPHDQRAVPAATTTAASGVGGAITAGSGGGTYVGPTIGCSATGTGGWNATTIDAPFTLAGGGAGSLDLISAATALSLTHDVEEEIFE